MVKILVLSDIHGRTLEKAHTIADDYELILIAGDVTQFGGYEDAKEILEKFVKGRNVCAIYGNCDNNHVGRYLDEIGINVHAKKISFDGITIGGFSGAPSSRFNTPGEFSEDEISSGLSKIDSCDILLTHVPAFDTSLDVAPVGHIGSHAVREKIESAAPRLHVCGHVHEARGIEMLNTTMMVNPGPYFSDYYAKIEMDEKIKARLCTF